ncbi:MAG: hypothetical protein R2751_17350 [Bacteroidales bacterium]
MEIPLLILYSTGIDYPGGTEDGIPGHPPEQLPYLVLSLVTNLGLLFFFKYFNFAAKPERRPGKPGPVRRHPTFKVLLPVGISFYTFQTLSYTIDVYLGKQKRNSTWDTLPSMSPFSPAGGGPISERYTRAPVQANTGSGTRMW